MSKQLLANSLLWAMFALHAGSRVVTTRTNQVVLEASTSPDLILLDLNMPRINGFEVLKEVQKDPGLRRIPIIVFTTSNLDSDITGSYEHSANAYIVKPAVPDDYLAILKSIETFWFDLVELPPKYA